MSSNRVVPSPTGYDDYWRRCWRPLRFCLIMCGIDIAPCPAYECNGRRRQMVVLMQIAMFAILTLTFLHRCIFMLKYVMPVIAEDNTAFFHVAVFSINVCSYIVYVVLLVRQKHTSQFLSRLFRHLTITCDRQQLHKYGNKWFRITLVFVVMLTLLIQGLKGGQFALYFQKIQIFTDEDLNGTISNNHIPIFGTTLVDNYFVCFCLEVIHAQLIYVLAFYHVTFAWVCSMLQLSLMSIKLPNWPKLDRVTMADVDEELRSFQSQHQKSCVLVREANRLMSFINLILVFFELANLVFVITVMKTSIEMLEQSSYMSILIITSIMITRNHFGAKANSWVFGSFEIIKSIDSFGNIRSIKYRPPSQAQMEFQQYCTNLSMSKPNLSLWGLFVFKKGLIISIAGTMVTYSLIVYSL